jgi:hypothetical protein
MARTHSSFRIRTRLSVALGLLLPFVAAQAQTPDRSGAWWRADESGWGLFTVDQGNVLLPTWFTYDAAGKATWFTVAGAVPQADGSYTGEVYRYSGVPFGQIAGTAADPGQRVGTARLSFPAADRMDFAYTVNGVSQNKSLSRFDWGDQDIECSASNADPKTFDNFTALWWNPAQNGWGLQMNHVGDLISATWYTYGEDRAPAWFILNASRQPDGGYSGALYRGRSGVPFSQINGSQALGALEEVGSASLRFSDGTTATFSHTQSGVTRSVPITRAQFGSRVNACRTVRPDNNSGGEQCYPALAVGDRFLTGDSAGGRIEQRITGTSTYKGRPVFVLEDRVVGNANATVREFVEQTETHRIYLGGEGYIPEAQTQGTYEYDPPVRVPRSTPVGSVIDLAYVVRNRYTAQGMQVSADVNVVQKTTRTGSADVNAPAGSFSGACVFETELDLDTSISTAGFTVRTTTESLVKQWAHPSVGAVRSETDSTTRVTTSGGPIVIPPTVQTTRDVSQLIEAEVAGRRYP